MVGVVVVLGPCAGLSLFLFSFFLDLNVSEVGSRVNLFVVWNVGWWYR
jgi:hypothetical protein